MKKYFHLFGWIMAIGLSVSSYAQVNIIPVSANLPELFTLEDLFRVNLLNTSGAVLDGKIKASVFSSDRQMIAEAYSLALHLETGTLLTGKQINWQRALRYGPSTSGRHLQQTGQLHSGSYSICYEFIPVQSGSKPSTRCFEKEIQSLQRFELLSPYDQAVLSSPYPILSWQPLRAFRPLLGTTYSLKLVAMAEGQPAERALAMNPPLLQQSNLTTTVFPYPPSALPLIEGKNYAWQVSAKKAEMVLGSTQIWQFTYQKAPQPEKVPEDYSYTYASTTPAGHFTLTKAGNIYLAYNNHYSQPNLIYSIKVDEGHQNVQFNTPAISLQPGLNLIKLPLKEITTVQEDMSFLIQIQEPNGSFFYLPVKHFKQ